MELKVFLSNWTEVTLSPSSTIRPTPIFKQGGSTWSATRRRSASWIPVRKQPTCSRTRWMTSRGPSTWWSSQWRPGRRSSWWRPGRRSSRWRPEWNSSYGRTSPSPPSLPTWGTFEQVLQELFRLLWEELRRRLAHQHGKHGTFLQPWDCEPQHSSGHLQVTMVFYRFCNYWHQQQG